MRALGLRCARTYTHRHLPCQPTCFRSGALPLLLLLVLLRRGRQQPDLGGQAQVGGGQRVLHRAAGHAGRVADLALGQGRHTGPYSYMVQCNTSDNRTHSDEEADRKVSHSGSPLLHAVRTRSLSPPQHPAPTCTAAMSSASSSARVHQEGKFPVMGTGPTRSAGAGAVTPPAAAAGLAEAAAAAAAGPSSPAGPLPSAEGWGAGVGAGAGCGFMMSCSSCIMRMWRMAERESFIKRRTAAAEHSAARMLSGSCGGAARGKKGEQEGWEVGLECAG